MKGLSMMTPRHPQAAATGGHGGATTSVRRRRATTPGQRRVAALLVCITAAAALIACAAVLAACGGSSTTDSGKGSGFDGTWNLNGAGMTLDPDFAGYSIGSPGEGGSVTITDGATTITMTGSNGVTWQMVEPKVEGDTLSFKTGDDDPDTWGVRLTSSGAQLMLWDDVAKNWPSGYPLVRAK